MLYLWPGKETSKAENLKDPVLEVQHDGAFVSPSIRNSMSYVFFLVRLGEASMYKRLCKDSRSVLYVAGAVFLWQRPLSGVVRKIPCVLTLRGLVVHFQLSPHPFMSGAQIVKCWYKNLTDSKHWFL